jgi:hypothetical protein
MSSLGVIYVSVLDSAHQQKNSLLIDATHIKRKFRAL